MDYTILATLKYYRKQGSQRKDAQKIFEIEGEMFRNGENNLEKNEFLMSFTVVNNNILTMKQWNPHQEKVLSLSVAVPINHRQMKMLPNTFHQTNCYL